MKKTLVIVLFLVFAVAGSVSAQTSDLPSAGSVPGSPFYFVDRFFEGIGTFFTFSNSAKATRYLALAEERLAEAQVLTERGDERAQEAVAHYEEQVSEAKERATQAEELDLEEQVTDATTKHLAVLDDVLERVPEQAKASIQAVKERSIQGQIEALRGIAERDPEVAVDIFSRAAEGRLMAAQARANRGGDDETEDVEEALNEFSEYATFGKEISGLAEGLQTGETTVEELVERATSRHLEILQDVQSRVSAEAQDGIQRAMENAGQIQNLRPTIPTRTQPTQQQQGAPGDTGASGAENAPVDTNQFIPPQAGQGDDNGEEAETEIENETGGAQENAPIPEDTPGGRP